MALSDILLLGNPLLLQKSDPVEPDDLKKYLPQIHLMFDTILDFRRQYGRGRAMAAPQIGLLKRIICLNIDSPVAVINPELTNLSTEMIELWDDCMSFPNLLVKLKRHKKVTLSFFDENWQKQQWELNNDMAELIQHEYDHLDGILAIHRAEDMNCLKWKA